MAGYAEIDPQITRWAEKNSLVLFTHWAGGETRSAYVSSIAGECFQIWIDPPVDGKTTLHAGYVEGPKDPEPSDHWQAPTAEIEIALQTALQAVLDWMAPSERFFPKS